MASTDFIRAPSKKSLLAMLKKAGQLTPRLLSQFFDGVVFKSELKGFSDGGAVDHGALSGLADDDHVQYLRKDGSRALTANWDAGSYEIRAQTLESDVATGTAPLTVASTTVVTNLNADKLDGYDEADFDYALISGNDGDTDVTGAELEELTDGSETSLHVHDHGTDLNGLGDDDHTQYVLRSEWLQNGFADQDEVALAWDDGTLTLTVSPAVTSFSYFLDGVKYTETGSLTETITDTEGLWVFYLDSEGSITSANNPSTAQVDTVIRNYAIIAYVYWDADTNDGRLMPELHGASMSPDTHAYLHFVNRAQYLSGMAPGDLDVDENGSDPTHAQFSLTAGAFVDEDIYIPLDAVAEGDPIEIWYRDGADGDWRWTTETITGDSFPVRKLSGTDRIAFNEWTGATWQQGDPGDNDFVLCHIFATNITDDTGSTYKYIAVQGQAEYTTLGNARDGATTELLTLEYGTLPIEEVIPVATFIYQTNDSWSGSKIFGRIRSTDTGDDFIDWRETTPQGGGGSSATDHGSLAGLSDDDHAQYLLASDATDRTTFATNWTDLTDAGDTALHGHDVTGLTNWPTIDYSYVSGNDAGTDVSAAELEELTDGSTTTLHDHDSAYYTEGEVDTLLGDYLPLTGGTLSGTLEIEDGSSNAQHEFASSGDVDLCQQGGGLTVHNGYVQLPYLAGAPASPANGMIWMESDGLHIYYNGAEKVVAGA